MTYEETVETINNIRRFGNLSGVEITARMLKELGHPEQGMKKIHIAGTNGKGSVSAFLCEILSRAGLRVGMFTSPHLVDFRERVKVNGQMISKEDTARLGSTLLKQDFGVHPTMFDYCLAMAVLYFKEQNCDVIILETGMGGRLDSTNALGTPEVSVITKIGYDHMAVLGNTLEEIASEKAGIIKEGTRLIMESQEPNVLRILLQRALAVGVCSCEVVKPDWICNTRCDENGQSFSFREYGEFTMDMLGVHQYENAAAAILAAEAFFAETKSDGRRCKEEEMRCIREGVCHTHWMGRMEVLSHRPFLLVDGAHNSNGVAALRDSLVALFPGEKFHFIMGVMADKDYEKMVELLLPLARDFRTVTVESSRALQAEDLARCIREKGVHAECSSLAECFLAAKKAGTDKVIAFGSLYFIGELEAMMRL